MAAGWGRYHSWAKIFLGQALEISGVPKKYHCLSVISLSSMCLSTSIIFLYIYMSITYLCIYLPIYSCIYLNLSLSSISLKFHSYITRGKRLTTISNKIGHLYQYTVVKVMWIWSFWIWPFWNFPFNIFKPWVIKTTESKTMHGVCVCVLRGRVWGEKGEDFCGWPVPNRVQVNLSLWSWGLVKLLADGQHQPSVEKPRLNGQGGKRIFTVGFEPQEHAPQDLHGRNVFCALRAQAWVVGMMTRAQVTSATWGAASQLRAGHWWLSL
jgi:hypothetical protein